MSRSVLLTGLMATTTVLAQPFSYIGCVSTSPDAFAIAGAFIAGPTPEQCQTECESLGRTWAALGGGECLCDDPKSGVKVEYVDVEEIKCDAECIYGDVEEGFCGGGGEDGVPQVYSLYKAKPTIHLLSSNSTAHWQSSNSTRHWTPSNSTAHCSPSGCNATAIAKPPPHETSHGGEHSAAATPPACLDSTCELVIVSGALQLFVSGIFSTMAVAGVVLGYGLL
ncbi:hypothetical protein EDB81DRAFT_861181 [Dactylonectria macrodidyma]|uniref:WSC domain-containing protein n=1 Tax=Dactylonectria macrodidyma TaxID=307937 RepID=A0A9P9DPM5_9HYPO|nr:hypothetical protein EDB81DRAFT_861181 [Dactylonectria macrodidyma]